MPSTGWHPIDVVHRRLLADSSVYDDSPGRVVFDRNFFLPQHRVAAVPDYVQAALEARDGEREYFVRRFAHLIPARHLVVTDLSRLGSIDSAEQRCW
ncbi:hypothetical protein [Nocardia harenae]|uniref:hypothetical protein n=1 Tax=Nocardia harenae TaxID=358707 RepID=UPI000AE4476B|nr:hypothetical protein [Nocardia harenae]